MRRAAPRGLAAPKLLTMRIPCAMQRASTGAAVLEQRLVAVVRIDPPRQLRQRQGALGQALEDQERGPAGGDQRLDHRAGGVGAVAGEAGARSRCEGAASSARIGLASHDSRPRR
jgi:hypothetical protein